MQSETLKKMTKKAFLSFMLLLVSSLYVAAADTLFVRQTDTIVIRETRYKKVQVPVEVQVPVVDSTLGGYNCEDNVFFVYFPMGRYSLDDDAQKAVHEMAERLEENPEMGVRLTGYCDYVGSAELNSRLSLARATVIANRLKKAYEIDEHRIIVEGKGRLENVKADYSPNRRVEMRLVNVPRSTASVSAPVLGDRSRTTIEVKSPKQEVSPRAEERTSVSVLATVDVTPQMTLAQLARKYYQNPFCWVYIYAMNKSVVRNPNALQVGQRLRLPELSEVDKQITKQESEEYYRMLRR